MANTFLHRAGHAGRQVAVRARHGRDRARDHGQGRRAGTARSCCRSTAWSRASSRPARRSEVVPIEQVPRRRHDPRRRARRPSRRSRAPRRGCRTLVWNGPLGAFEIPPFDAGTNARGPGGSPSCTQAGRLMSVAGGGDTVAALAHAGVLEQFSYVSTAGGAFLEWLEGKELPGVAVLRQAVGSAQVVVHDLEQARAALARRRELGCAIELRSAPGAAAFAGVGYLQGAGRARRPGAADRLRRRCRAGHGGAAHGLPQARLLGQRGAAAPPRRHGRAAGRRLVVEAEAPDRVMLLPEDDAAAILRARFTPRTDLRRPCAAGACLGRPAALPATGGGAISAAGSDRCGSRSVAGAEAAAGAIAKEVEPCRSPPRSRRSCPGTRARIPGVKGNLARLLMHGRLAGTGKLVILPVDQGYEHGPARSFARQPAGLRSALSLPARDRCRAVRLRRAARPARAGRRHLRRPAADHPQDEQRQQPGRRRAATRR